MKAIETVYAGHRFRSRLEARWAVFFNELGIEWQYEPEGFETSVGWYLPDFWLPKIGNGWWIEVKATEDAADEITRKKLEEVLRPGQSGMVVLGAPADQIDLGESAYGFGYGYEMIHCYAVAQGEAQWARQSLVAGQIRYGGDTPYRFCLCWQCGKIGIEYDGRGARVCRDHCEGDDKGYTGDHPRIVAAALAARQARFEHKQIGAPHRWTQRPSA